MKSIFSALAILLLWTGAGIAADSPPAASSARQQTEALSEKLAALGSFQAEYKAEAPDRSGTVTIRFDRQRRYCFSHGVMTGEAPVEFFMVLDFTSLDTDRGDVDLYMINNGDARHYRMSLKDLFAPLDGPFGMLFSMVGVYFEFTEEDTAFDPADMKSGAPFIALGLDEASFLMSLGVATSHKPLAASWLETDTVADAVAVSASGGTVTFAYPGDHVIDVDAATGLMTRDRFPDPKNGGIRQVTLTSYGPLVDDPPWTKLIPGFSTDAIRQMPADPLFQQMTLKFMEGLGRGLAEIDGFETVLADRADALHQAIRSATFKAARPEMSHRIDPRNTRRFVDEFLMPAYDQYRRHHPETTDSLSFADFLDIVMNTAEADPGRIVPPGAVDRPRQLSQTCRVALEQMDEEARRPLAGIYQAGMNAFAQGWVLAYLSATLEQAAAMAPAPSGS